MSQARTDLPRIFQANLDRLFQRVVMPGLRALEVHDHLVFGQVDCPEQFFYGAAAQVDNYTANEASKAYALTLMAVFERQLRIWGRDFIVETDKVKVATMPFKNLLALCAAEVGIDLVAAGLAGALQEGFLVANVVRHSDGPSSKKLFKIAPNLWKYPAGIYLDLLPPPSSLSEQMRLTQDDVTRYARAIVRFWGRADRQPLAIVDPPW